MMAKQQNGMLKLKLEIPTYLCKMVIQMSYLALVLFLMLTQVNYSPIQLVPQLNHLGKIIMQKKISKQVKVKSKTKRKELKR